MSAVASEAARAIAKKSKAGRTKGDLLVALAFLLPNLLGFLLFTAGPVFYSLVISFTDRSTLTPDYNWVGFRNYGDIFADPLFWTYLVNTAYFFIAMPLGIAGSLFLATLLHQKVKGTSIFRVLLYLPSFTAGVALMIMWKTLLNPDFGLINAAIGSLGVPESSLPGWLNETKNLMALSSDKVAYDGSQWGLGARDAIILMGLVTGIGGGNMLLYLAALSNVPEELGEAAALDGATGWSRFRHITWPQLAPTTFFIVIMGFIGGFQGGFDTAKVMTGGGPAGTTTTIAYHIYTKAFESFQIGYASAVSWILFAIVFAVTMINWKFGNREDLVS